MLGERGDWIGNTIRRPVFMDSEDQRVTATCYQVGIAREFSAQISINHCQSTTTLSFTVISVPGLCQPRRDTSHFICKQKTPVPGAAGQLHCDYSPFADSEQKSDYSNQFYDSDLLQPCYQAALAALNYNLYLRVTIRRLCSARLFFCVAGNVQGFPLCSSDRQSSHR
jgi:hypothetical protein